MGSEGPGRDPQASLLPRLTEWEGRARRVRGAGRRRGLTTSYCSTWGRLALGAASAGEGGQRAHRAPSRPGGPSPACCAPAPPPGSHPAAWGPQTLRPGSPAQAGFCVKKATGPPPWVGSGRLAPALPGAHQAASQTLGWPGWPLLLSGRGHTQALGWGGRRGATGLPVQCLELTFFIPTNHVTASNGELAALFRRVHPAQI